VYAQFFYFADQLDVGPTDCLSLWGCLKAVVGGMRNGGGIGDAMIHTLGTRWIIDMLYFVIVIVLFLNLIFGIIIDTFSELRSQKQLRMEDTTNRCFICGITKHVFNKKSDGPNGFKTHIMHEHNMWSYLFFIFFIWQQVSYWGFATAPADFRIHRIRMMMMGWSSSYDERCKQEIPAGFRSIARFVSLRKQAMRQMNRSCCTTT
jgi:hypothetical protein